MRCMSRTTKIDPCKRRKSGRDGTKSLCFMFTPRGGVRNFRDGQSHAAPGGPLECANGLANVNVSSRAFQH